MAIELGIPRSTAVGWLGDSPKQVVSLDLLSLDEQELQHEVGGFREWSVLSFLRPKSTVIFLHTGGATSNSCTTTR